MTTLPPIQWTKATADRTTATVGPFSIVIEPKGDGRWSWSIFNGERTSPTATGIARSLPAAKNNTEQYVKRSGLV